MHSQVLWIRSLEHCFPVLLVAFQRSGPHVCTMGSGRILNEGFFFFIASQLLSVLLGEKHSKYIFLELKVDVILHKSLCLYGIRGESTVL